MNIPRNHLKCLAVPGESSFIFLMKIAIVCLQIHRSFELCMTCRFGTAASSPNRKSRLDSLDEDVPVPAAAPAAKASGGAEGRENRIISRLETGKAYVLEKNAN
jgi:hypothetical protein